MYEDNKDLDRNLANFLIQYRNTPHSVTGTAPSVAMFKRSLRSRLNLITPQDRQKVENMDIEKEQELLNASQIRNRQFEGDEKVYIQKTNNDVWTEGIINQRLGTSNMYDVQLENRNVVKHADHIKKRLIPILQQRKSTSPSGNVDVPVSPSVDPSIDPSVGPSVVSNNPSRSNEQSDESITASNTPVRSPPVSNTPSHSPNTNTNPRSEIEPNLNLNRRSKRNVKKKKDPNFEYNF